MKAKRLVANDREVVRLLGDTHDALLYFIWLFVYLLVAASAKFNEELFVGNTNNGLVGLVS